jgi:hypothetical protein
MKRERIGRNAEALGNLGCGHSFRTGLDERAVDLQPAVLREGAQEGDGAF